MLDHVTKLGAVIEHNFATMESNTLLCPLSIVLTRLARLRCVLTTLIAVKLGHCESQ